MMGPLGSLEHLDPRLDGSLPVAGMDEVKGPFPQQLLGRPAEQARHCAVAVDDQSKAIFAQSNDTLGDTYDIHYISYRRPGDGS